MADGDARRGVPPAVPVPVPGIHRLGLADNTGLRRESKAKSAEQRIKIQHLAGQIEMYKLEVGKYPENLAALAKQPGGVDRWNGPYVKEVDLKDSWGND